MRKKGQEGFPKCPNIFPSLAVGTLTSKHIRNSSTALAPGFVLVLVSSGGGFTILISVAPIRVFRIIPAKSVQ